MTDFDFRDDDRGPDLFLALMDALDRMPEAERERSIAALLAGGGGIASFTEPDSDGAPRSVVEVTAIHRGDAWRVASFLGVENPVPVGDDASDALAGYTSPALFLAVVAAIAALPDGPRGRAKAAFVDGRIVSEHASTPVIAVSWIDEDGSHVLERFDAARFGIDPTRFGLAEPSDPPSVIDDKRAQARAIAAAVDALPDDNRQQVKAELDAAIRGDRWRVAYVPQADGRQVAFFEVIEPDGRLRPLLRFEEGGAVTVAPR